MKVKYIVLAVLAMFSFSGCDEEYAKVPLTVPVDFSKKGTVYETDFQAPWNIWGSRVEFYLFPQIDWTVEKRPSEQERYLSDEIRAGDTKTSPHFKIKITLTPLGWASHEVPIMLGQFGSRKEKLYTKGQVIEEIVSVPLYGGGSSKTIMIADLQRLRNYHVRVESLEDVELPNFERLHIKFGIGRFDRKI